MKLQTYLLGGLITLLTTIAIGLIVVSGIYADESNSEIEQIPIYTEQVSAITPPQPQAKDEMVRDISVVPNSVVASPLVITGEARGTWFFEASFPVILLDSSGTELARTSAQSTHDWMTEDFIPFTATIEWAGASTTATSGVIILKKDNPTGLTQHDDERQVPILF